MAGFILRKYFRNGGFNVISGLVAVLLACSSCFSDLKLERALVAAEENRSELEKVLKHYSLDSPDRQKYKAAVYLIRNMMDCYSLDYVYGDEYVRVIDSLSNINGTPVQEDFMRDVDSISRCLNRKILQSGSVIKCDLRHLTAGQLIRHIDMSFESLRYPWTKELDFSDFCEYVLPHRIGHERLEEWMTDYRNSMKVALDSFARTAMADSCICSYYLRKYAERDFFYTTIVPELSPSSLLYSTIGLGNCKELQALTVYSLRSLGIPVAIDFTPQWGKRSLGHSWCTLIGKGYQLPFLFYDKVPLGEHLADMRKRDGLAKVYRRMYSEQEGTLASLLPQEEIPPLFEDKHLKDVSELYFTPVAATVNLSFSPPEKKEYAYLSVFNNKGWIPIDWGRIKNGKVEFKKVAKGNAYLATYYHRGKTYPASNPFIVEENGDTRLLAPDVNSFTSVFLRRKYPDKKHVYELSRSRTVGGRFQIMADVSERFTDVCTIDEFPETLAPVSIVFDTPVEATALRYLSAPDSNVFLAELELYDEQDNLVEGEIIGTDGSWYGNGRDKYKVFDHDMLTYFDAPVSSGGWVGLSFGRVRKIKGIVYAPYNDDNGINKGELYELFYFDAGWVSLGEKYGDSSYTMNYDRVPRNALLLLRNKTKGQEVRIFTQEDGKHEWW